MERNELIRALEKAGVKPIDVSKVIALCESAADELKKDDRKFIQLNEINEEVTNLVLIQSRHIREYEEMSRVRRLERI